MYKKLNKRELSKINGGSEFSEAIFTTLGFLVSFLSELKIDDPYPGERRNNYY